MSHLASSSRAARWVATMLACVLATGCAAANESGTGSPADDAATVSDGETVRVTHVYDGDTIAVGSRKVRLLGINTPERGDPYYAEAAALTRDLALNEKVVLEFDVQERDQYGRELAYVHLPDGRMLNLELVRQGYAQVYTIPPNVRHTDDLLSAEREARRTDAGLWRHSDLTLRLAHIEANAPGPDEQNVNGEWVEVVNDGEDAQPLYGVTLSDESNNVFTFPERALDPGARVRVYSGRGSPTAKHLYWGRRVPVWNNSGDHAFLRDPDGRLIDDAGVSGR